MEFDLLAVLIGVAITVFSISIGEALTYSSKMDEYFIKAMQEKGENKEIKLERWRGYSHAFKASLIGCGFSVSGFFVIVYDTIVIKDVVGFIGGGLIMAAIPWIFVPIILAPKKQ